MGIFIRVLKLSELSNDVLQECFELIEKVFEMFIEWAGGIHLYTRKHSTY